MTFIRTLVLLLSMVIRVDAAICAQCCSEPLSNPSKGCNPDEGTLHNMTAFGCDTIAIQGRINALQSAIEFCDSSTYDGNIGYIGPSTQYYGRSDWTAFVAGPFPGCPGSDDHPVACDIFYNNFIDSVCPDQALACEKSICQPTKIQELHPIDPTYEYESTVLKDCLAEKGQLVASGATTSNNACGAAGKSYLAQIKSQAVANVFNTYFSKACDAHDTCYGTCDLGDVTRFEYCNLQLQQDALAICYSIGDANTRGGCLLLANAIYEGVHLFGETPYNNAQSGSDVDQAACICKPCSTG